MTPRKKRLLSYALAATVIVAGIVVAVVVTERSRRPPADDTGIVDVLAREMPEETPTVHFVDGSAAAGIDFRHFAATRSHQLPEDMGSGLAWGDCDKDGFPDLYLVNFAGPLGLPGPELARQPGNALYRNRGDGTFVETAAAAGADLRAFGMGATWGDYDGDDDLDLFVTNFGPDVLLQNRGDCSFIDVTAEAGVAGGAGFSAGAAWSDYDGDDDLDLYVTRYIQYEASDLQQGVTTRQYGRAVPFTLNPASYDPAANILYRNDGDGRFTAVTDMTGVANASGRSLSAAWCDWDEDGDVDLYVANDISDNAFFRNRGDGTFEDASTLTLTADYRGAMGLAVADYDRDGDLDFFVTHWIAQENALYENHLAGGRGSGDLLFTDAADLVGLGATGLDFVGWGTAFIDYDNDGWKDLFVANGHTFEDQSDTTRLLPQRMQLFWNRGDTGFYDVSAVAGPPFERLLVARGAAAADFDRDGDVDLAVLEHGGPALLLTNRGADDNHWLELDLEQPGFNRRGVGALIRVEAGGAPQLHSVGSAPSYMSQDELTAHFGLGPAATIDRVVVRWPDGTQEAFTGLTPDRRHLLRRTSGGEGLPTF